MSVSKYNKLIAGLLFLGVALIFVSDNAEAGNWSYEMDDDGLSTATSQDGKYVVVGSKDDHVYLFQSDSSTPLWSYDTGKDVNSVAISADGWSIVAGSINDDIMFWHRNSSTPVWEYDTDSDVILVDITADGQYVVATNEANRLYYFNTDDDTWDSKKYMWRSGLSYEATGLSLADNGMSLSVASGENFIFADLELSDDDPMKEDFKWYVMSPSDNTDFLSTALSSDGEYVVASILGGVEYDEYENPEIRFWKRDSSSELWEKEMDGNATSLAITSDGEYIVAGCDDDKVYLFDKDSSTPSWSYDTGADVNAVSMSSDGQFVVAGQEGGKVFLFKRTNSTPIWSYTNPTESSFLSIEISKDGDVITATGEDGKVYVFNNNVSSSLSVIPYAPIYEEIIYPEDTLRWYWSSSDDSSLKFDIYLGNSSSNMAKIASNLTSSYYVIDDLEVHTYHYWKVVAKDSTGTYTSDTMKLYKKWWWSFYENSGANEYSATISADGEYVPLIDEKLRLFGNQNNVPHWETWAEVDSTDSGVLAISSDGEYFVVAQKDWDYTIQLFQKDSSQREWYFDCNFGPNDDCEAIDIGMSHDGSIIVGIFDDGYMRTWNKNSNVPIYIKDIGTDDTIRDLSMSADGNNIVVSAGESIYLFDGNNNSLWNYEAADDVYVVEISADGEYIITGDDDETIYFFNKDSNEPIWDYDSDGKVRCVDISSDGEYMVIGTGQTSDRKVYVFDKDIEDPLWEYDAISSQEHNCVDISENGKFISASYYSDNNRILVWNRDNSTPLWKMSDTKLSGFSGVFKLESSASGRYISAAPTRDEVPFFLFENIEASEDFLIPVSPRSGNEVASPQLIWFAGSDDRANLTFDVYLGTNASSLTKVADDITALNYSPSNLAMGTKYYWKVVATDPSGSITSSVMNFTVKVAPEWSYDTGDGVHAVAVSADGEYIVSGSQNGKVFLFKKGSNVPLWTFISDDVNGDGEPDPILEVEISADGSYIAAGGESDFVYLLGKSSNSLIWKASLGSYVTDIEMSADGSYIAAGGANFYSKVKLYSRDSNSPLQTFELGTSLKDLALSSDGKYLATANSNYVKLFTQESTTSIWSYDVSQSISTIDISDDGEYVVVGTNSGDEDTFYIFNKDNGTPLWSSNAAGNTVNSVSISSDGEYLVLGSTTGRICLFDKDSSTPLWTYNTGDNVQQVAISKDGNYILAKSDVTVLLEKNDSNLLWNYEISAYFAISADAKYISLGSSDDSVYLLKNDLIDSPWLLSYDPRNGSNTDTDPQLSWFASSDDRDNLTFDVYLSTSSNPTTKVADNITTFYYNAQCLDIDTKYYWKVVATDGEDTVTSSIMNFTVTTLGSIFCVSIDDDYDPDTLTIKKGSTVIWTNDDNSLHTVTEDDDEFDSGSISPGNTWSYTFDTVGSYNYSCQYDDDLDGQIIVLVSYKPTASIDSISPQIAELDSSTVSFSGSGSDSDGTISEYKWISSIDGDLSNSASFSITDLSFGNHTITFRVKDNDGVWSDNQTSWVDVRKTALWKWREGAQLESVHLSEVGSTLVFGSADYTVGWHYIPTNSTTTYNTGGDIWEVDTSADGTKMVAASSDDYVYFFERNNSSPFWKYETDDEVRRVAISASGKYIIAASQDEYIYFFDSSSSIPLWTYDFGPDISSLSISADGSYITASRAGELILFGNNNNTPLWVWESTNTIGSEISADGNYIVATRTNYVYLFDKDSNTPLWAYEHGDSVRVSSISTDGSYIAIGAENYTEEDSTLLVFSKNSNTPIWTKAFDKMCRSVAISQNSKYVVAGCDDEGTHLFLASDGNLIWEHFAGDVILSVSISADGYYVSSGVDHTDRRVYLFDNLEVYRPSILPYGPRSGSLTLNDTTLRWFPGSDDITNLTFDVYLSWVKNDVLNNNSAALVADDITNYTHYATSLTESKKYYWKVVATDGTGSVTSKLMNFTVLDTTAPVTNITGGPPNPSNSYNATFNFTANEDDVTFKCKMDTGGWYSCSSPKTYYNLDDDKTHQFQVKATDSSGNEGEADAWIWTINDITAPNSTINSRPDSLTSLQNATFSFTSNEDDVTFECKLDGGYWSSCSSPKEYDDLSEGNHTFYVRATDDNENVGPVASYSWQIDITDPVTTINSGPSNQTYSNSAQFTFSSNEDSSTFNCKLDYGYWFDCSSPENFSSVEVGNHVFYVKATDLAGNEGEYDTWSWEVLENDIPELVNYNVNPIPVEYNERVYFYSNFSDSDGYIDQYYWSSSLDGFLSNSGNFSTYELSIGNHLIDLSARDDLGSLSQNTTFYLYVYNTTEEIPEDVVAIWNFEEGSGTTAYDLSGDDNHGVLTNGPSWTNGIDGVAVDLDGSNDYIVVEDGDSFNFTSNFSISVWFKFDSFDEGANSIVNKQESLSSGSFKLQVTANFDGTDPYPTFTYISSEGQKACDALDSSISTDAWMNMVVVKSSSSVKIYIDGLLSKTCNYSEDMLVSSLDLLIGAHRSTSGISEYTNASIDELIIWEKVLSSSEILNAYVDIVGNEMPELTNYHVNPNPALFGQVVQFYSNFSDSDGYIEQHYWSSSIDGLLSNSGNFSTDTLSLGNHSITIRAKDSFGYWSSNTTFELDIEGVNSVPQLLNANIIPEGPVDYGDRIYFSSNFSSCCDIADLQIYWNSSIDGVLASGRNWVAGNFSSDELSAGYHQITLQAMNGYGWSENSTFFLDVRNAGGGGGDLPWVYDTYYQGADSKVTAVAISGDGKYIVAGDMDAYQHRIFLFDSESGSPLWYYNNTGELTSIAISEDGQYFVAVNKKGGHPNEQENSILLFDKNYDEPVWIYDAGDSSDNSILVVDMSANGQYIVAGTESNIIVFDKSNSSPLWYYNFSASSAINDLAISLDGNYFTAGSSSDKVYYFSIDDDEPIWIFKADNEVYSVDINSDGSYIVAGSRDGYVYLFNENSSSPQMDYHTGGIVRSVSITNVGDEHGLHHFVASTGNGTVYHFAIGSGNNPIWTYDSPKNYQEVGCSSVDECLSNVVISGGTTTSGYMDDFFILFDYNGNVTSYLHQDQANILWQADVNATSWSSSFGNCANTISISGDGSRYVIGTFDSKIRAYSNNFSDSGDYNYSPYVRFIAISPNPVNLGEVVSFNSNVFDPYGNIVEFVWESNIDGFLSNSANFSIDSSNLSIGNHNITFTINFSVGGEETYSNLVVQRVINLEHPYDGDPTYLPITLSWSSPEEMIYDVYLDDNNIQHTSHTNQIYYHDGFLWLAQGNITSSILKIDLETYEHSLFVTHDSLLNDVLDLTIDSSGNVFTVSRPEGLSSSKTYVCKWSPEGTIILCNDTLVIFGVEITHYQNEIFVLQASLTSSHRKLIILNDNLEAKDDLPYGDDISSTIFAQSMAVDQSTGNIFIPYRDFSGTVREYERTDGSYSSDNYEEIKTYSRYPVAIEVKDDYFYVTGYYYTDYYGGLKKCSIPISSDSECETLFNSYPVPNEGKTGYKGTIAVDDEGNIYVGSAYKYGSYNFNNFDNDIFKFAPSGSGGIGSEISRLSIPLGLTPIISGISDTSFTIDNSSLEMGKNYYWFVVGNSESETIFSDVFSFEVKTSAQTRPFVTEIFINPKNTSVDEEISFSASFGDNDGWITDYQWFSDIDGLLSDSAIFNSTSLTFQLTVGEHNISFRVQDNTDLWSEYSYESLVVTKSLSPILGCTNAGASNYNPDATSDDGSCAYDTDADVMFYLPPEGQTLLPEKVGITYGVIVNSGDYPDVETLENLSGIRICLETGGSLDNYLTNFYAERGMIYDSIDASEESGMGQTFFTGRFCGVWVAKYDTLVEFDNSYSQDFERRLLDETFDVNFTEETFFRINAQYTNTAGLFRSDRQPVNVGSWDYFSTVNDTITINYAELWWQDLENGDDSCTWTFNVHHNGIMVNSTVDDCHTDGTNLSPVNYSIQSTFTVSEGDHIQIEVIYEGWNDIMLFYGSEMHPSGFSISGLIDVEEVIEEEPGEDLEEIIDDGTSEVETPGAEVSLPFELNAFTIGLMTAAAGLVAAAFAEAGARQSVTKIIDELQALVDAGVTDSELNKSIEELENMEGLRYLSSDRADALELLNNYNEVQGQALGAMQQLDELESVVAELEAAGVSSPELDAEIADIQSMLETQLEGDTSEDYSKSMFEQFKQKKGGE